MKRFNISLTVALIALFSNFSFAAVLEEFNVMNNQELQIGNLIEWKTSADFDIKYYNIQKSDDGVNFTNVGESVSSKKLASAHYRFLDVFAAGKNSYRLAMINKDGQTVYSDPIDVSRKTQNDLIIMDVPAFEVEDLFEMEYEARKEMEISYQLLDANNKVLLSDIILTQKGTNKFIVSMNGKERGYYKVILKNGKEREETSLYKL